MATIDFEKKDSYLTVCYLKENGRKVATIQSFGEFARIFPAISMEGKVSVTDWRSASEAQRALERLAINWST